MLVRESRAPERVVATHRLETHVLVHGDPRGEAVVFLHGNCSSGEFFRSTVEAMPAAWLAIAPDLRGFGGSEAKVVDATRGLRDFADDVWALLDVLVGSGSGKPVHLVGHSMGGGVAMQMTLDRPQRVASLTLESPVSPYGFGGTRDVKGTPTYPDFTGSGAGTANPEFVRRLREQDQSEESLMSPLRVMNEFFFRPPFRAPNERELLGSVLSTRTGEGSYPGDVVTSDRWPGVAPGTRGVNNALSPKYMNLAAFADVTPRPPVLWIRGAEDAIVSDASLFDFGYLGALGAVPGWPGADAYPPQPMVSQMAAVLDRYEERGGHVFRHILEGCGHSPHVEQPDRFLRVLTGFLLDAQRPA